MDNTIKDFGALSQSLYDPDSLIVDYKQYFDPGGPKFQCHINASIDDVYFSRLFDPGGGPIGQDCSPFINVDTKILA
eukprot:3286031-Ditylum_brightwellii.AAC.1